MITKQAGSMLAALAFLSWISVARAALISVDGGTLINDSADNLTWVSDANLFATQAAQSGNPATLVQTIINDSGGSIYTLSGGELLSASDFNTANGAMTWGAAEAWINYLNAIGYQGYSDWRLPATVDQVLPAGSYPASSSQLAQLFVGQLGEASGQPINTSHNSSFALFTNLQNAEYWSGTETSANPNFAWEFAANVAVQGYDWINSEQFALAVRVGQVSAVPLPASACLMLSGLVGLAVMARHRSIK